MPCGSMMLMNLSVYLLGRSLAKMKKEQQLHEIQGLATVVVSEQLDLELNYTCESESSKVAVVVSAVGSYCVALGAVPNILVGLLVRKACRVCLVLLKLDNLGQLGLVGMLRNCIYLWVIGKLKTEKRFQGAIHEVGWNPRGLSRAMWWGCKCCWKMLRWLGTELWRRLRDATEQGGLQGGVDEGLLLPSPDVAHAALQLCACCLMQLGKLWLVPAWLASLTAGFARMELVPFKSSMRQCLKTSDE